MIGTTLGQYRIVLHLGNGSMGDVYRAVDELLDRDVALKVLRSELDHRGDLIDRFRSEARTLARLDHPNIARLWDLKDQPRLYMVMEYVNGETLLDRLARGGRLRWREAISFVTQLLTALQYAHGLGVVHRDIKPANVMVRPDGCVKVTDFGIARVLGEARATRIGHVIGTLAYMAPEQIRGEDVLPSADLYSTGVLLYELLTGRAPFAGGTDWELMQQHMHAEVPSLKPLATDVPAWLDDVIRRALGKAPEDRFESASAFRLELERLTATEPIERVTGTRLSPLPEVPRQPARPTREAPRPTPGSPGAPAHRPTAVPRQTAASAPASAFWRDLTWRHGVAGAALLTVLVGVPVAFIMWRAAPAKAPAPTPASPGPAVSATLPQARPFVPPAPAPPRAPAPPPGNPLANPPAVEARKFPVRQFEKISLVVADGDRTREQPVILRLGETAVGVRDRGSSRVLRSLPYDTVLAASYKQTEHSTLGVRTKRHWLTLRGAQGEFVLRLDKDNYEQVLQDLETRTTKIPRSFEALPVKK